MFLQAFQLLRVDFSKYPTHVQKKPTRPGESKQDHNAEHSYSEDDLAYFKSLIMTKRSDVLAELYQLRQRLAEAMDRSGGYNPYASYFSTAVTSSTDQRKIYSMIMRQQKQLGLLDRALQRIATKRYGICKVTGKRIPKERLEALLHTEVYVMSRVNRGF